MGGDTTLAGSDLTQASDKPAINRLSILGEIGNKVRVIKPVTFWSSKKSGIMVYI